MLCCLQSDALRNRSASWLVFDDSIKAEAAVRFGFRISPLPYHSVVMTNSGSHAHMGLLGAIPGEVSPLVLIGLPPPPAGGCGLVSPPPQPTIAMASAAPNSSLSNARIRLSSLVRHTSFQAYTMQCAFLSGQVCGYFFSPPAPPAGFGSFFGLVSPPPQPMIATLSNATSNALSSFFMVYSFLFDACPIYALPCGTTPPARYAIRISYRADPHLRSFAQLRTNRVTPSSRCQLSSRLLSSFLEVSCRRSSSPRALVPVSA